MRIRKIKRTDIPKLINLVRGEATIEDYHGEYSKKVFGQMLSDKNTTVFVMEDKKRLVAFEEIVIDRAQKRIYIGTIVVSKKYRGRGIGSTLIKEAESFTKKRNYKRISFVVRKWNKPMNSLVKKLKYKMKDELFFWEKEI